MSTSTEKKRWLTLPVEAQNNTTFRTLLFPGYHDYAHHSALRIIPYSLHTLASTTSALGTMALDKEII